MEKTFTINEAPYSIRCLLYHGAGNTWGRVVVYGHGFGGHKENGAARRFAEYCLAKYKDLAVLCFDWPCHGEDGRKKLTLDDCCAYLRLVTEYAKARLGAGQVFLYATSFGGYVGLKLISEQGNPFTRVALRCPAVDLYGTFFGSILTDRNRELLAKGKTTLAGFDRKIKIGPEFLREVRETDLTAVSFLDWAEDILILHGTADEIVPIGPVEAFADDNVIELVPIPGADHRFIDPDKMTEAILRITAFFGF